MKSKNVSKKTVVTAVMVYAKKHHGTDAGGHDWPHIERVWKMAKRLARTEGGDFFVIELAALCHDIADWKESGNFHASGRASRTLLQKLGVSEDVISHVEHIVNNVSYKGGSVRDRMTTLEGKIVQDADRLDAIGAIAIARTFAWGGTKERQIYDSSERRVQYKSFNAYKGRGKSSIAHFYDKLLLLKDRLNTRTARKIANPRHRFMQAYLKQFFMEWRGR